MSTEDSPEPVKYFHADCMYGRSSLHVWWFRFMCVVPYPDLLSGQVHPPIGCVDLLPQSGHGC